MIKRNFTAIDLIILIAIILVLMAMIIPALQTARSKRPQKPCTNNLKQIGLAMSLYFADGSETEFPKNTKFNYLDEQSQIVKSLKIDLKNLTCKAQRVKAKKSVYVVPTPIQGMKLDDFENVDSIIAYDGTTEGDVDFHKTGNRANALFGDGHVQTINTDLKTKY